MRRQYRTQPVIDINPQHKALRKQEADRYKTPEWKALYKQRTGVKRAYSRLKESRSVNDIKVRRRRKVTVHCYLSLIAIQAAATQRLASSGQPQQRL